MKFGRKNENGKMKLRGAARGATFSVDNNILVSEFWNRFVWTSLQRVWLERKMAARQGAQMPDFPSQIIVWESHLRVSVL